MSLVLKMFKPSPSNSSRDRLRAAMAARDTAQQAIDDAQLTVERLHAVIRTSDDAARAAANASHQATEALRAWVINGCKHSESRALQALDDAAVDASRAAESAGRNADVVTKTQTLARAQSVVQSAQADVRYREQGIAAEIGMILADESAPLLRKFERLAEEYRTARREIMALRRVLYPDRYEDAGAKSDEGAQAITDALRRGEIASWDSEREAAEAHDFVEGTHGRDQEMMKQLMEPWRDRAAQLRADAANSQK